MPSWHLISSARLTLQKLRNSANFIIRNLRTGLKKTRIRTANENEVIETVRIGIEMANEKLQKDVDRLTKQLQSLPASDPARTKIQKRIENKQKNHPVMPTSDHWMLTYETLDAVMKNTKNPDYYAMPSQANQQVLRKVLKDWKSYFELLASYRQNPGKFKAQPKQPDISGHLTRPLPLPIRLQSGLISKEKCTSHFHAAWCRSVLERRKALISERKLNHATVDIWYM
ncbi:MAG: hypothetical protein ACLRZ6_01900 [Lachnospiraceae bacterium]